MQGNLKEINLNLRRIKLKIDNNTDLNNQLVDINISDFGTNYD